MKPGEIINATSPEIKKLIEAILSVERDYQHFSDVTTSSDLRKEIEEKIITMIDKATTNEA